LRDGISDENYKSVFEPIIRQVMESYDPSAIVLQCGTDSLSGDKLGCLNLSMRGHANCVKFVKSFNKPLLLLGGGGYTMRNVSRAWAFETGLAAGVELGPEIPVNEYYEYFGPDYELDVKSSNTEDMNTPEYLERVKNIVMENLRKLKGPPSVQMTDIPKTPIDDVMDDMNQDEDLIPSDSRRHRRLLDSRVQADGELSDSDDEGEGGRRDYANHKDRGRESRSRSSETESGEMRRFGIGGGILSAGAASSTHGAGPSGHTTLISQTLKTPLAMDTDELPSAIDNGAAAVESTSNGNGNLEISKDDMAVDENSTEDN